MDGRDCLRRSSLAELERSGLSARVISEPSFVAAKPLLDGIEYFDSGFFGISNSQAEIMDPAHRIFLECVWEAMEHGGIVLGDNAHTTGVFAGVEGHYLNQNLRSNADFDPSVRVPKRLGNLSDYFSLRVSHELNLVGPSLTALATCSTSLMAVHLAIQNLRLGECTIAVAGGARIDLPAIPGYCSGVEGMFSRSGVVRPLDAAADGTIFGDGAGVVVLKLLNEAIKDGSPIHGVIRGSGFCNDGRPDDKRSFTAPTPSGQKRAINQALKEAAIDPKTIGYIECHGTGTLLGDPTEVTSLTDVFHQYTSDTGFCALGSVKGNIGHLGPAAGVVTLIKACLALTRGVIPPMANYDKPNPEVELDASPFFVNTRAIPWAACDHPRRAGVSAFGFGGPNAHIVLEEFVIEPGTDPEQDRSQHLLVVSAKTEKALQRRLTDLASFVEDTTQTPLADIAHTLQCGRQAMAFRSFVRIDDQSQFPVSSRLRNLKPAAAPCNSNRPVVLLFPGQGSQAHGMGQGLYDNEPVYRETIEYYAEFLDRELGFDLRQKMHRIDGITKEEANSALTQTAVAQPALFIVEYALAKQLQHWGLRPTAMLGHSLGELVAACLADVFSLDDGLRLVAVRSRLMQKCDPGSMVAVSMPLTELLDVLPDDLDLAAVNSPTRNVVAGPNDVVARFVSDLSTRGISCKSLNTSHAFHSRMLDVTLEEFRNELRQFDFSAPSACVISNVSGAPLTESQARNPDYWVDQRRLPVRFSDGLNHFLTSEDPIFLEVGPGRVLARLVNQNDPARDTVTALYRPREDVSANAHRIALDSLGLAWSMDADIDWPVQSSPGGARKVSLPNLPLPANLSLAGSVEVSSRVDP
jgi:acyl transferase domain-containing protein